MADSNEQLGTGKHPHKSSEDPRPHTKEAEHGSASKGDGKKTESHQSSQGGDTEGREYRDTQGEVHHHTHTYLQQHAGEQSSGSQGSHQTSGKASSSGESGGRRESKEENHRHQEEGAQKRIDELGQQHHSKK